MVDVQESGELNAIHPAKAFLIVIFQSTELKERVVPTITCVRGC